MRKILITGATGQLGTIVVNKLIEKNESGNISVFVRDPSRAAKFKEKGIEVFKGDYNDYDSLIRAFKGVEKLYFISASDIFKRLVQHENVVKAAKEAKVDHIIYTSFQRKTDNDTSPIALVASAHLFTEQLIKESGLTYTILKHALYADSVPMFLGDKVLSSGVIFLPAGDGRASFTSRGDMASAGVAVLTGAGHENKTYEISVNKSYSFTEIASILSEISGKQIRYESPDPDTFTKVMEQSGLPEGAIKGIVSFCSAISMGEFDFPDNVLEKLLGREPESLKITLKKAYKL